jgi:hypothetical protein
MYYLKVGSLHHIILLVGGGTEIEHLPRRIHIEKLLWYYNCFMIFQSVVS